MKHRITLVEDDTLILELIRDFLNASEHFEVRYTFVDGASFYDAFPSICTSTDLIILDYQLGNTTAEKLLEVIQLEQLHLPVIVFTS